MPVSGLSIHLHPDEAVSARAESALRAERCLELGTRAAGRVAAVLDTPDAESDRAAWERIRDIPGVEHVDVVFIHFDEPHAGRAEASP
jgi:nitrate reductase NapAB chaperone NapD